MTLEAPAHTQRFHLRHHVHLVNPAVARHAADASRYVRVVREVSVVGESVDSDPMHRPTAGGTVPNRREHCAVLFDKPVAVHAGLRRRNVRDGRRLNRGVTVSAVETELADVQSVTVRHRLNGSIAHIRVPRGKVVPNAGHCGARNENAGERSNEREFVPPGRKYLGQCLGLPAAG